MSKPKTGAERVAALRKRRAAAGGRRVDAELTPAAAAILDVYMEQGMSIGQVLSGLLEKNPPSKKVG